MIEQVVALVLQTWAKVRFWALVIVVLVIAFFLWGQFKYGSGYKQCKADVQAAPKETSYVEIPVRLPADSIQIEEYKAKLSKAQAAASRYRSQYAETAKMYRDLAARLEADSTERDSIPVTIASLDTVVQDKGDTTAVHVEYWYPPVNEFRKLAVYSQPRFELVQVPVITRTVWESPPDWAYGAGTAAFGFGTYYAAKEKGGLAALGFLTTGLIYYFFMRE